MRIFITALLCNLLLSVSAYAEVSWTFPEKDMQHVASAVTFSAQQNWREVGYHAKSVGDPDIRKLLLWMQYRSKENGASFEQITQFIKSNPQWPDQNLLKQRAEEAITLDTPAAAIVEWFAKNAPLTGDGFRFLGEAKAALHTKEKGKQPFPESLVATIRESWIKGNFGNKEEDVFLQRYGHLLRQEDHHARIDQLLWQEKIAAAQRVLHYADRPHQKLFIARIQLMQGVRGDAAIHTVPESLMRNPGLLFERIKWRKQRGDVGGVRDLLQLLPPSLPYPSKWWDVKNDQIRLLLKEKKFRLAYKMASTHNSAEGTDFAESMWLSGWIALRFLNDPGRAYQHFYKLYHGAQLPITLGRSAYWAGRAAEENGNQKIADGWYKIATKYPDTFYGQLALLHMKQPLSLPASPVPTAEDKERFRKNTLAKAAYALTLVREYDLAKKIINHAVTVAKTPGEMMLLTELGVTAKQYPLSVEAAKRAARKGVIITKTGYPSLSKMPESELERALTLAIIRQESSFDKFAVSPVGALGLMQLLPSTGKEVAKELRVPFEVGKLKSDYLYNIQLGTHYMRKLIRYFDGSYVLAVAAYNGGIGNVRKWIREYGNPHQAGSLEDIIDWIEYIPFSETRNYVQRVLEGTQIYRTLLRIGPKGVTLETDLKRGMKEKF